MECKMGYIYIRKHPAYKLYDVYKLGKTDNIPTRDSSYATGEVIRGKFKRVFEVENMAMVEELLQQKFIGLNFRINGGTEFYKRSIVKLIEPFLTGIGIKYVKLTQLEIGNLTRSKYPKASEIKAPEIKAPEIKAPEIKASEIKAPEIKAPEIKAPVPRDYQNIIIDKSVNYFKHNDKGVLELICGVGKTLISLWTMKRLMDIKIIPATAIIGVPNILLLDQWKYSIQLVFPMVDCLIIGGNTCDKNIKQYLQQLRKYRIIVTTYHSAHVILDVVNSMPFTFGMMVNDEAHHLTKNNEYKVSDSAYIKILNIKSVKRLSVTATLKNVYNNNNSQSKVISNDNVAIFGEVIDTKNLTWAIHNKIVCDYIVQTIVSSDPIYHIDNENDRRLYFSAFAAIKGIINGGSRHLLIYTNSNKSSKRVMYYIKLILELTVIESGIYYSEYAGTLSESDKNDILDTFKNTRYGIISCVYCLGEGWDFPILDTVIFAENMASDIRIVQSALRPIRKDITNPSKIAKIILPLLQDTWDDDNTDFTKIKNIIYKLGLVDESITQRISVSKLSTSSMCDRLSIKLSADKLAVDKLLTDNLRLITIKRSMSDITYIKSQEIIHSNKLHNKEKYLNYCNDHNTVPRDPIALFKLQFKGWVDYLSIDTTLYYDLETCKRVVKQHIIEGKYVVDYLDILSIWEQLCDIDSKLPRDIWDECYNIPDLSIIVNHLKPIRKVDISAFDNRL